MSCPQYNTYLIRILHNNKVKSFQALSLALCVGPYNPTSNQNKQHIRFKKNIQPPFLWKKNLRGKKNFTLPGVPPPPEAEAWSHFDFFLGFSVFSASIAPVMAAPAPAPPAAVAAAW